MPKIVFKFLPDILPGMSDDRVTIQSIKDLAKRFRDERDWSKFHDPKNLAMALSIEAGELMEHFLWIDKKDIQAKLKKDAAFREDVADELADVFVYALHLARETGIDIAEAVDSKMSKNAKKYPIEKSKGRATKYTKL